MSYRELWRRFREWEFVRNLISREKILKSSTRCIANQTVDHSLDKSPKKILKPFSGFSRKLHELDIKYMCNPDNSTEIQENIRRRKLNGDINLVQELYSRLQSTQDAEEKDSLIDKLTEEALKIPNKLPSDLGDDPQIIRFIGEKPYFSFLPKAYDGMTKKSGGLRTQKLGNVTGKRSYFLCGVYSQLEEAIVHYTMNYLISRGFQLVSVPDMLPASVVEGCGMSTRGDRNQVYRLDTGLYPTGEEWGNEVCLSGTSEMALAAMLAHDSCSTSPLPGTDLPLRLCAVSRCYRAEISSLASERGLYRVHEFTKVEMFGVCTPGDSAGLADEFVSIEEEILTSLGLHARVLRMGAADLGPQAHSKVDIEAWMPGRAASCHKDKIDEFGWGEVSSCSDCTDFQARRLGIHYIGGDGRKHLVHTVNGTAAAIPRLLIALLEIHQNEDQSISIPLPLQPYMNGLTSISSIHDKQIPLTKPLPSSLRSRK